MKRRDFLSTTALAAGGAACLGFSGFAKRASFWEKNGNLANLKVKGYGELFPKATRNTGETLLALPKGFEYNAFGKVDGLMKDGRKTPRAHDGMATFSVKGELRVVRNHEVANKTPKPELAIGSTNHYDDGAGGGTTTLVINPKTRLVERDFVSLSGTLVNCAGGATPWGSWISCEETTLGTTVRSNGQGGFSKPHGYCFEVWASLDNNIPPNPLKAMGRFVHEAVAFDRKTGIVYLTEDNNPAGFYRFLPNRSRLLSAGGKLQILKIKGKDNFDTRTGLQNGASFTTHWVTIEKPDPEEADVDSLAVFKEGEGKGAATFSRLEGAWAGNGGQIYFTSTNGGTNGGGQIWQYEPNGKDDGKLTLLFESPDREILDMPDNICVNPQNNTLFICEDSDYNSGGGTASNFMRVLTPTGKIFDFAKNIAPGFESSEFAGSAFSPDGKTLFVNLQTAGITLAIWGDWANFKV